MALLNHWFNIGSYTVLLIGCAMLLWGSLFRLKGWVIPGGILSGIGLGILVTEGPWHIPENLMTGVFLLCFSMGWFSIVLLTGLRTCPQWWAAIPGGIMAVIGASILATNGAIHWDNLSLPFAVVLIVIGLFLLVSRGWAGKDDR